MPRKANENFTDTSALSFKTVLKLSHFSYRATKPDLKAPNNIFIFSPTSMSSEGFSFPRDTAQLSVPVPAQDMKMALLVPACAATRHLPAASVQLSSNNPLTNDALRDNTSLPALFSHSMS